MTMQALTDTAPVPVEELTVQAERFAALYAQCGNASTAYRKAYNVAATTLPNTVHRKAHQPSTPRPWPVASMNCATPWRNSSSSAPPPSSSDSTRSPRPPRSPTCASTRAATVGRPTMHTRGAGAAEFAKALDAYGEAKGTGQRPSAVGGFSFDPFASPCPTCPECMGAGKPVVYLPDTTKSRAPPPRAMRAPRIDKYGVITVEQHDAQDAAFELHRMIPGAIAPARTESSRSPSTLNPSRI